MKLRILAAICALVAFSADASAGPIRDRIRDARPGILVPKRAACGSSCGPCQSAPAASCAGGSCSSFAPAQPHFVYPASYPQYLPTYQFPQSCPNGRCQLK